MERIDIGQHPGERRERFFARSIGTQFVARSPQASETQIDLYDEIGFFGVTAKDFRDKLKNSTGDIVLRINSPGGDVFDGIAIYNDLVGYAGKVKVEITGVAASAATIVAMAGDEIAMAENAFIMIHNAWVLAIGNRHDLTDAADTLEKIDDAMARTYASRTKTGIRSIKQMMDDETWMTAKEAKDGGFADSFMAVSEAKAKFDLSVYARLPEGLRCGDEQFAKPETDDDIEKLLMHHAGRLTRSQARALKREIRAGKTSLNEAMPSAGDVQLGELARALRNVNANFPTSST